MGIIVAVRDHLDKDIFAFVVELRGKFLYQKSKKCHIITLIWDVELNGLFYDRNNIIQVVFLDNFKDEDRVYFMRRYFLYFDKSCIFLFKALFQRDFFHLSHTNVDLIDVNIDNVLNR